ncbi:MAG: fatty acid desaturase, partial [Planctomycetes bacterium]|nr:fatty acid desaturase [Planctomycetota bacterium]
MANERNLRAVLKVIPEDCYDNPTWKGLLYIARDFAIYAAIVAGLILVDNAWLILLWIAGGLSISGLFILGHDAAHKALFKSNRMNRVLAQLTFLPSLHIHEGWVFGHNRLHHAHTVRQQMDFVWHPTTPAQYAELSSFKKLVHRIFWSPVGAGIYYLVDVWWVKMMIFKAPPKQAAAHRVEKACVLLYVLLASAALAYGGWLRYGTELGALWGALWMWTKVFLVPFVVWNYSIGLVVYLNHISPEVAWWKRSDWTRFGGQMEGTTVIRLPWILNVFYHNIFLHIAHHVDTRIPFYGLPKATQAISEAYSDVITEKKLSLFDYLRITRACKLFDFESGRWLRYGEPVPAPVPAEAPAPPTVAAPDAAAPDAAAP